MQSKKCVMEHRKVYGCLSDLYILYRKQTDFFIFFIYMALSISEFAIFFFLGST